MKLIKFNVENIEAPDDWNYPYYRVRKLEKDGRLLDQAAWDDSYQNTMLETTVKTVDYEMVILREGKKEWRFFVNFEEARLAMPMLQGVINNQNRKLMKEKMDLTMLNMQLQSTIKKYESYWFNRFWNWISHNK